MRRGRPKAPLTLTDDERETLERWVRRPTTAQALAQRARIVLACVSGRDNSSRPGAGAASDGWSSACARSRRCSITTRRPSTRCSMLRPPRLGREGHARRSPPMLVSCPRDSLTKAFDGGEDLVSGLGPHEGLRVAVRAVDVIADGALQFEGTAVRTPTKLPVCELGEEALDLIDPGRAFGREMDMKARASQQPALDQRRLVRAVVVEDEMNFQLLRDVEVDGVEELAKLDSAVTTVMLGDDLATLHVERGKQRRGTAPYVVMRPPFDLAGLQRQDRLRAIQRLNLGLLVHAQHDRAIRRIQVEPDDVPHLLDQERVRRQLETLAAVRAQAKGPPNPRDTAAAEADPLRQRPRAPVCGVARRALERQRHRLLHGRVADLARRARPGLV